MPRAAGAEFFSGFVSLCLACVLRLFGPALLRLAFAFFFEFLSLYFARAVFFFEPALLSLALALFCFESALLLFAHCLALALSRFVFAPLLVEDTPARHFLRGPAALRRDVRSIVCIGC